MALPIRNLAFEIQRLRLARTMLLQPESHPDEGASMLYARICTTLASTMLLAACQRAAAVPPQGPHSLSHQTTVRDFASANVRAVDQEARVIILEAADGNVLTVEAADGMNLAELRPGDRAQLRYEELVDLSLASSDQATMDVQSRVRQLPHGLQLGRSVTAMAEVVSIEKGGSQVTLRGPQDAVHTMGIESHEDRRRLAKLEPGDAVALTYTETLAVSFDDK
jgi:hypothetical protein